MNMMEKTRRLGMMSIAASAIFQWRAAASTTGCGMPVAPETAPVAAFTAAFFATRLP
jgi:hypothetical protein